MRSGNLVVNVMLLARSLAPIVKARSFGMKPRDRAVETNR
jgi:hypothetical protein